MNTKKFWIILIIGIILRIFLSFTTFHPDIRALNAGGQLIANDSILNLYEYSSEKVVFNYPPIIYWFLGFFSLVFGDNLGFLKLSYLPFDIALGLLLTKMVDPKKSILVFSIWIFNSVSLYATYMMGQFDIIPTFFSILSVFLALKNKLSWAALALGFGIAFKLYPIFLMVPLIILGKGLLEKTKLLFLAGFPYLVSILPYLSSEGFRSYALFANQSSKSLYANISVSGGESILIFPTLLILFYLFIWSKLNDKLSLWRFYLIPLLLFFIFTHFHPQWLIWVTPFLILDLVYKKFKNSLPIFIIFGSWFLSLFFFDPSLTIGIFSPLFPTLQNAKSIWQILNISIDYNFSRSIIQTVFVGASAYLIYDDLKDKSKA